MHPIFVIIALFAVALGIALYANHRKKVRRIELIDSFVFPSGITTSLRKTYPQLSLDQINQCLEQLREYFHLCNIAMSKSKTKPQQVGMPSKVVDQAWHEFILFTKQYEGFCQQAFGRFLHHTPATAMASEKDASESLRTAWRIACHRQNINPLKPEALPPIFAIDTLLGISDGFAYSLDPETDGAGFDARKIGCNGGKGSCGGAGYGGQFGCSSDGSGCSSGGCSGGSCGGGCGGN
ncbi:MAG: glycine-rich domain-containing protein [Porticoccaceae bacterium]